MSQEELQTMVMLKFWGVIEVYYGIVQVVNCQYWAGTSFALEANAGEFFKCKYFLIYSPA